MRNHRWMSFTVQCCFDVCALRTGGRETTDGCLSQSNAVFRRFGVVARTFSFLVAVSHIISWNLTLLVMTGEATSL